MAEIITFPAALDGSGGYDEALKRQLKARFGKAAAGPQPVIIRRLVNHRMVCHQDTPVAEPASDDIVTGWAAFLPEATGEALALSEPPQTYRERQAAKFLAMAERAQCQWTKTLWRIKARDADLCEYREPQWQMPEAEPVPVAYKIALGVLMAVAATLIMVWP